MYEGYRALELIIGPFKESEGKTIRSGSISILSTGSKDTFKIHAKITKKITNYSTISTISVWNLSKDTINRLRTPGLSVRLMSGYENGNMETLYVGGIVGVTVERRNNDIVTNLLCRMGSENLLNAQFSKTYSSGALLSNVIKDIASSIEGITIDPTMIRIGGTIGRSGWSFMGNAIEALNRLGYQFGFSWTIDNGVFVSYPDGQGKETGIVLDENSGLKKVSPQLFGIFQFQKGIDVESVYIQGVGPFKTYTINSRVNPELNGDYLAHTIEYDLCPKTNSWDMDISFFAFYGSDFS